MSDFTVNNEGTTIAVHQREAATGLPVLLVHGAFGNAGNFDFDGRSLMAYLAERGFDVYALDLRGAGDSYHPDDYSTITIENRTSDVVAVAKHVATSRQLKLAVIGHSAGAIYAARLAGQHQHRGLVCGVGLLASSGHGSYLPPEKLGPIEQVVTNQWTQYYKYLMSEGEAYGGIPIDPVTLKKTIDAETFHEYYTDSWEPDSVPLIYEVYNTYTSVVTPCFSQIQAPTLVMDGLLDSIVGPAAAQDCFKLLTAVAPEHKTFVILERNGHSFLVEDERWQGWGTLDGFLKTLPKVSHIGAHPPPAG